MFPTRLKELRLNNNLTQEKLAELMGVSQQAVGLWERNKNMPSHDLVAKLASQFKVTTDYLLGLSEYSTCNPSPKLANPPSKNKENSALEEEAAPLTPAEIAMVKAYRKAPKHIRDIVNTALKTEFVNENDPQT